MEEKQTMKINKTGGHHSKTASFPSNSDISHLNVLLSQDRTKEDSLDDGLRAPKEIIISGFGAQDNKEEMLGQEYSSSLHPSKNLKQ